MEWYLIGKQKSFFLGYDMTYEHIHVYKQWSTIKHPSKLEFTITGGMHKIFLEVEQWES